MKTITRWSGLLAVLLAAISAHAATLTWTNNAGGDWNDPANWSPNQVPAAGDDVVITNAGTYSVTNAASVTLGNLTLGGANGTQILTVSSLTLNNAGLVNANGVFNWGGGDLEGSLTVAPGGTLTLSNAVDFAYNDYDYGYANTAALTNYGTVVWAGTLTSYADYSGQGGAAIIDNAGLWEAVADNTMGLFQSAATGLFLNTGTLEKIGGTGTNTSTINWNFLNNEDGTISTPVGSFSMGDWNGNSLVAGNVTFSSGTISGTLVPGAVMNISGGTINGALLVSSNAVLNWSGGDLESSLTVAPGGTLTLSNAVDFAYNNVNGYANTASLTNYGTVVWAADLTSYANYYGLGGAAIIDNAGLWEAVADNTMGLFQSAATGLFLNTGTLEKIGGTGTNTSTINWNFLNIGDGTIYTPVGSFSMGDWTGNGLVAGNVTLSGGTISGTLVPGAVINISGTTINGALLVSSNAVLNWSGGDLEGSLTVAQGGTLTLSNAVDFAYDGFEYDATNTAALTNYGTVVWAGTLTSYANYYGQGGAAIIDNAGLWEAVADNTMGLYGGVATGSFINTGTLEKIGGVSTSTINWNFLNLGDGTIYTPVGSFNMGDWTGNSLVAGNVTFSGGTINGTLTVSSNAVFNWGGGDLEGSLTVAQGGTLTISNAVDFAYDGFEYDATNTASLTNYGTVVWAGTLTSYANYYGQGGAAIIDNAGLWEAVADNTMGLYGGVATGSFINTGTLEKIGGSNASIINWSFLNLEDGTIRTPVGSFSMGDWTGNGLVAGNVTLSGGTISGTLVPGAVINISGTTINGALLVSSNAVLNWSGGDLEGSLTVAQGGTLTISNAVDFAYDGFEYDATNTAALTNYGTVVWAGTLTSYANYYGQGGAAIIDNAGLWEAVADNTMGIDGGGYASTSSFLNTGTLEKIGGTSTSTINWNFLNLGDGTIYTPVGSFNMGDWTGNSLVAGNVTFSGGTINGTLTVSSNAVLNWSGGDLEGSLTVVPGGTLILSNAVDFAYDGFEYEATNTATLTNYGTVVWAGSITSYANYYGQGGAAIIDNAGLWEAVADNTMGIDGGGYASTSSFLNTGTLEKIGGTSTSTINWNVLNPGGILGSQTNTLALAGNYDLTGGTLNAGLNCLTNYGIIQLAGGPAALTGSVSANLNNGYVPATGSSFPVLTYSSASGVFTNFLPPYAVALQTDYGATAFTLTVLNVRPALAAIASQMVDELTALAVTNSANDPDDGQTLTFALVSAPGGMSINSSSGVIHWTPAQTQSPATNTVVVSVSDNGTPPLGATNSFTVIVREVNVAPALPFIAQTNVNELTMLTVTNTAAEANIHSTTTGYTLVNPPAGMSISASGIITWTPSQAESPGTNTITTVVTNTNPYDLVNPELTSTNAFTVIVREVNVAPVLPVVARQTVNELTLLTVTNTATDSNIHSALAYALLNPPAGMGISANGIITWTPGQAQSPGTNIITTVVTSTDNYDLVNPQLSVTNSFTVVVKEVNVTPVLPVIAAQTVNELNLLTVTNAATDSNIHAAVGYALVNAPAGVAISTNGIITWTPGQTQSPGTNTITTVATSTDVYDEVNPALSVTNSFTVIVKEVNVIPVLPVVATQTVNELTLLTVTNTATDSNMHATLAYALLAAPAGVSIGANGVITWTPTQTQSPGTNTITTVATSTDNYDQINPQLSVTNSFTVMVKEVNVTPVLPVVATQTVNELTLLTVTNTATDSNIHTTPGYVLVNPPAGMVIDTNGIITWTPGQTQSPGTNIITTVVSGTDNYDLVNPQLSVTNSFTVVVKEVNVAPVLPVVAAQSVYELSQMIVTNAAIETNIHATLTYALVNPPAGATIYANGIIAWTPSAAQSPGTNSITTVATASDAFDTTHPALSTTNSFMVMVIIRPPITLTGSSVPLTGQFQFSFDAAAGLGYTVQYSTNLFQWTVLQELEGTGGISTITDTNASDVQRFYRVSSP